jgi:hypothetical protein
LQFSFFILSPYFIFYLAHCDEKKLYLYSSFFVYFLWGEEAVHEVEMAAHGFSESNNHCGRMSDILKSTATSMTIPSAPLADQLHDLLQLLKVRCVDDNNLT